MRLELQDGSATVTPLAPRRRRADQPGVATAVGAAAALAIAVLGGQVVRQQEPLDDMESALERDHAPGRGQPGLRRPRRAKVQLQSSDGEMTARAVVLPDGSGFLMAHELPGLDERPHLPALGRHGHRHPGVARPARRRPRPSPSRRAPTSPALAITEEEAGGVTQSRNPAVIAGAFD